MIMTINYQQNLILPSRYDGDYVELIPLNENIYKVDFTHNPYSCRTIFKDNPDEIEAFDPSGGPFVSVGSEIIPHYKVFSINRDKKTKDLLVTLEYVD